HCSKVEKVTFLSFTKGNFRNNLKRLTGMNPSKEMHAHHVFAQEYKHTFFERGINVHNPEYGVWWDRTPHLKNSREYNDVWKKLLFEQEPPLNKGEILEQGRKLMAQYGINVNY